MKWRIKVLYLLTIAGIAALICTEGYWLKGQYLSSLVAAQEDMYGEVLAVFRDDKGRREQRLEELGHVLYRLNNTYCGDSIKCDGVILFAANGMYEDMGSNEYQAILELAAEGRLEGVMDYYECSVKADSRISANRILQAMTEHVAMRLVPMQADGLARKLDSLFCVSSKVEVATADSIAWEPCMRASRSFLSPRLEVHYPLSPLDRQVAVATIPVPANMAVRSMAITLVLAFVVAMLLVFCLIYQMATIRWQQRVAELQRGFTLTMLHELKRPLGALKLFVSFMKSEKLGACDREAALANAGREIDNLSSYFNKLKAITYNEASEIPLSLTSFMLREAVEESAAMVAGAVMHVHGDGGVAIVAERQGIVNVLCNLIENAVKYSDAGTSIDIVWKVLGGSVEIAVADRGRGVADADKLRIFDQFYRAVEGTDIPGMGLGLAYVRQVVAAHGGSVSVADREGGGTVFTIRLPQQV